jgi:hypothetical protein
MLSCNVDHIGQAPRSYSRAKSWVEDEVGKVFAEEKRRRQLVLFPVRIDETVVKSDEPWAVNLPISGTSTFAAGKKMTPISRRSAGSYAT